MLQPANHHLAQLNIGRIRYEISDPRMADFADNLQMVNRLAERTPGFVRRFIDESGNSTATRPYSEPCDWTSASAELWKTARCAPCEHAA